MITPQEALQRTIEHREIFHDEMVDLMRQVMRGEVSDAMVAAILTGLRVKKETVGEIAGAVQRVSDMIAQIATAVEQQAATAEDAIERAVQTVHAVAGDRRLMLPGELHGRREVPRLVAALAQHYAADGPVLVAVEIACTCTPARRMARTTTS